ncbi:MAG: cell envelope integrity protein TolA [Pseudomonadota bacterium]
MFWTLRQYSLPLLLAVGLHAALGYWLLSAWNPDETRLSDVIKPQMVNSTLLVLEPKAKPKPPPKAQPKPAPAPAPAPAPQQSQPKPEPKVVEPQPDPAEVARQREREAAERAAEAARQQRLQALAETSFLYSLENESEDLAQNASAEAEAVAQSYRYGIYQKVVANWSRPPSARNGMEALLQVDLVPTGEVVAVNIIERSGSAAFDQSAEAAVRKARRFEVPKESAIFEQHFRRFTLLFRPEDLLR